MEMLTAATWSAQLSDGGCPHHMSQLPRRTGLTELSDAELLLFGFLFQWNVRRQALTHELYSVHMNCCYSHGLRDRELDKTLRSKADSD